MECPTCGKEDLKGYPGMVIHHTQMHPERFEDRFWARVDKDGEGECWEWDGSLESKGYGQIHEGGEHMLTHRVSYALERGDIGENFVLHHCDNRKCVNPNHLYLGDTSDNMQDMWDRGRHPEPEPPRKSPVGVNNPNSKLTPKDVVEIREKWGEKTSYELADEYNMSQTAIHKVATGKVWSHIDEDGEWF